jgi:hypothetical protein
VYDAVVREMRALAPRGTRNLTWVGMALEGHDEWDWWSTFLNPANHAPGTPLDWASFHFYASCSNRTDPSGYTAFFAAADGFVEECGDIVSQQRDVLNPSMKLDADGACLDRLSTPQALSLESRGACTLRRLARLSLCLRARHSRHLGPCRAGRDTPGRQLALRA